MVTSQAVSRRLRLVAWSALPVLGGIYYLLLVSAIPTFPRLLLLESIYCTPIALTVVWGLTARARSEGTERKFWGYLAAANFTLLLCEVLLVYWVGWISPAGPPRVSWPFHVLHTIAALAFIGSVVSLSRFTQASGVTRVRWILDTALVLLVVAVALLELYVRPIMGYGAPGAHVMLGLGYAIFAVMMALGTLGNVVGFKVDRWRPWDKMFAVALVIYAVATMLWPSWYQTVVDTSRNYERGVLDLVQFSGHWLLMAAAVYRLTEVKEWELRPFPPVDTARYRWASAITPAVAFVGVPLAAVSAVRVFEEPKWFSIYLVFFSAVTGLALARSVLISLENGVMFHRSVSDPLTGLANHSFFRDRLAEEVRRAERYGSELSVVLIDIDRFGDLNAKIGHGAADQLLQQVGTLLRARCSRASTVARLSADDFALIVPETGPLDASIKARRALDLMSIQAGNPGTITASAGIATYPQHAIDVEGLLLAAQAALRKAKQMGPDSLYVTNEP